jgi:nicotinamide riboside kinase
MTMKIAIIGTHSTGKTTLCHELVAELRKRGKNAVLVQETARLCPFPVNENTGFESQYWIFAAQIKNELELSQKHDILVCDRGLVDNNIYLMRKLPDKAALMTQVILEHCKSYDHIFKTCIEKSAESDGFRSTDEKFRQEIDLLLADFLDRHKIPHKTVSGEGKLRQMLDVIDAGV